MIEEDYSRTKRCRMVKADQKFFEAQSAFVLKKASPLTAVFNRK